METGIHALHAKNVENYRDAGGNELGNNLTLLQITQMDFTNYYVMGEMGFEELMQQFKETEHPFSDMDGKLIGLDYYAQLEQSDKVVLSVTADMDSSSLKIYETNGIAEADRTEDNTRIWECSIEPYLFEKEPDYPKHTVIIQKDGAELEKIELEVRLGAICNDDIDKLNSLYEKYPYPLSYTLADEGGVILASGEAAPKLGDRINEMEDRMDDLQRRYKESSPFFQLREEKLNALDRLNASGYQQYHYQSEYYASEQAENFIIWTDDRKNPQEYVLYNPIVEEYYHAVPSRDIFEASDTIRLAEQYMSKEQIEKFDSVRLGLPGKEEDRAKGFKEITLKFGKGCVGDEFKGKDGIMYKQILVPNVDKNDSRPWQTFVVKANHVHDDKFGKGAWIKLPADGHTTLKRTVAVGKNPDGKKEWGTEKTTVSNADLKKMVESYKDKTKSSLRGNLRNKNIEAKKENAAKQQDKDMNEKSTKKDLS